MTVTVIVDDMVLNRKFHVFLSDDDRLRVTDNWQNTDQLLQDLQHHRLFQNCTRWCDLKPVHYQFLIMRNLSHLTAQVTFLDPNDPVIRSLNFLLGCLIQCLDERADTVVEVLHVDRITDDHVKFSYHASLSLEVARHLAPTRAFKVVVDNTKDD